LKAHFGYKDELSSGASNIDTVMVKTMEGKVEDRGSEEEYRSMSSNSGSVDENLSDPDLIGGKENGNQKPVSSAVNDLYEFDSSRVEGLPTYTDGSNVDRHSHKSKISMCTLDFKSGQRRVTRGIVYCSLDKLVACISRLLY